MAKKYYWLKLNENFFEREEIKVIENRTNGKDYIIFYLKLLLKSIHNEGKLKFRNVIPYTPEMLANITNTNIDTVKVAIDLFIQLGLMDMWDDGTMFMFETQNMIGSETEWAEKKRKYRKQIENIKKLGQIEDIVLDKKDEVRQEIDLEKDIELEKEIDNTRISWRDILTTWNDLPSPIKPIRAITDRRKDKIKARINSLKLKQEDIIQAIKNIKLSSFLQGKNSKRWIVDFDWLFMDDTRFSRVFEGKYQDKGDEKRIGSNKSDSGKSEENTEDEGERLARRAHELYGDVGDTECDF